MERGIGFSWLTSKGICMEGERSFMLLVGEKRGNRLRERSVEVRVKWP